VDVATVLGMTPKGVHNAKNRAKRTAVRTLPHGTDKLPQHRVSGPGLATTSGARSQCQKVTGCSLDVGDVRH
jgi:hypothetical protein